MRNFDKNTSATRRVEDWFARMRAKPEEKPKYAKDEAAFESGEGVCYVDSDGNESTRRDFEDAAGEGEAARAAFDAARGASIEKTIADSWAFSTCPRCGKGIYVGNLLRMADAWCGRCAPLRTDGVVHMEKDPYDDGRKFWTKREFLFRPGVTTLVGCNGAGKTTTLNAIREQMKRRGTPCMSFDNAGAEGGGSLASRALEPNGAFGSGGDEWAAELAAAWSSSEGEKIAMSLSPAVAKAASVMKAAEGYGEAWFLFDALDSGLSVDMLENVKKNLFDAIVETAPEGFRAYVVATSNSWELSEGTATFDVSKGRYVNAKTYERYKKIVMGSAVAKKKRDEIFRVMAETARLPREFEIDWSGADDARGARGAAARRGRERRRGEDGGGTYRFENAGDRLAAVSTIDGTSLECEMSLTKGGWVKSAFVWVEKTPDGAKRRRRASDEDVDFEAGWSVQERSLREAMENALVTRVARRRAAEKAGGAASRPKG